MKIILTEKNFGSDLLSQTNLSSKFLVDMGNSISDFNDTLKNRIDLTTERTGDKSKAAALHREREQLYKELKLMRQKASKFDDSLLQWISDHYKAK